VIGSWITYALGSESQNLPAYVVLRDPEGYSVSARLLWSSGWLPALYQGVEFSSVGAPVHHLKPVEPLPPRCSGEIWTCWRASTGRHSASHSGETELDARIEILTGGRMPVARGSSGLPRSRIVRKPNSVSPEWLALCAR